MSSGSRSSRLQAPGDGETRAKANGAPHRVGARFHAWALAIGAAAVLATAGCTSPTLPLPPPSSPLISAGASPNTFKLSSINGAEPNALIVIVNRNDDLPRNQRVTGTIADENGSWDTTVIARVGDVLDISQESGSTRSPGTTVTVR